MTPSFEYYAQGFAEKFFGSLWFVIFALLPFFFLGMGDWAAALFFFAVGWGFALRFYLTVPGYRLQAYSDRLSIKFDTINLLWFRVRYDRIIDIRAFERRPKELIGKWPFMIRRYDGKWHIILNTFNRHSAVEIETPKVTYILECPAPDQVIMELEKVSGRKFSGSGSGAV